MTRKRSRPETNAPLPGAQAAPAAPPPFPTPARRGPMRSVALAVLAALLLLAAFAAPTPAPAQNPTAVPVPTAGLPASAPDAGQMTAEQAGQEKNKVRLNRLSSAMSGPGWDELPTDFRDLIERSVRLQERVRHLDGLIYDEEPGEKPAAENPVAAHMSRLAAAFPGQSED